MMKTVDEIFRYKKQSREKLCAFGFEEENGELVYREKIQNGDFTVEVFVGDKVSFRVTESDTNDEYILVHVESASGDFISGIREDCERILGRIADECFENDSLRSGQTARAVSMMKNVFSAEPDFVFDSYPGVAAFRVPGGRKWFGLIMSVERGKIGLDGKGEISIINLKDTPGRIVEKLKIQGVFPAYHMNKKHWYTVSLDGSVDDETLLGFLRDSITSVMKNNRKKENK